MQMVAMAHEQQGCRHLQRLLVTEDAEGVQLLLDEILPHTGSLMVDPFGNYLVQKALEAADGMQRRLALQRACAAGLSRIACNTHGTRAVQKLVETVRSTPRVHECWHVVGIADRRVGRRHPLLLCT